MMKNCPLRKNGYSQDNFFLIITKKNILNTRYTTEKLGAKFTCFFHSAF